MDLACGFHQVPMDEHDKLKTAFSTRRGLFHHKVMPFGIANAPSTFENLMEIVLRGLQWQKCVLYVDDVTAFGKDFQSTYDSFEAILIR